MQDIEFFTTQDGSIGLYDKKLDEIFHSKFGAKKEAFEKFVEPSLIYQKKPIKILDICYGIGYNTKCALENFSNIQEIDCLEINEELVKKSFEFEYSEKINEIIKRNILKTEFINFYIDDARKTIKQLNKKYDVVFHDGFSPHKQAVLWSEDFIFQITKLMHKDSIYCTYNHSKPVLSALIKAGLTIGKTIKNERIIATVASFNSDLIKNKFTNIELQELKTKSAITYKDKDLTLSHDEILKNRENEIKNSSLITLSQFKKQLSKQFQE
ncbi:MAG: hypothetical protein IJB79_05335 [Candidatus Gastranaerophilales bacterium]|nr:hypothetical protein [Candidatus Gastranaerophilales bacterium]